VEETASGVLPSTAPPLEPEPAANPVSPPLQTSLFDRVIGHEATHVVVAGETLSAIVRRYGTGVQVAAAMNSLADPGRLRLGQRLRLSNRRVLPAPFEDGLVIDLAVLRMYWLRGGEVSAVFPVAAGRKTWETPGGFYSITGRRRDPTWYVPPSIQREMREQGLPVKKKVPPGPDNPLGKYWLQLSANGIGIHGTNAPWSVGRYATHGCIRMREADIEQLYNEVPNDTPVAIIDDAVRIARLEDGRVFVEAHRTGKKLAHATLHERLASAGLSEESDLRRVEQIMHNAWGVAIEVTPKPETNEQVRS
jgi:L,D-transpeptidase ErfK/SrfK